MIPNVQNHTATDALQEAVLDKAAPKVGEYMARKAADGLTMHDFSHDHEPPLPETETGDDERDSLIWRRYHETARGWLRRCAVHYWGDIDTHGFAMLARARRALPQTESLLMDRDTLLDWLRRLATA